MASDIKIKKLKFGEMFQFPRNSEMKYIKQTNRVLAQIIPLKNKRRKK